MVYFLQRDGERNKRQTQKIKDEEKGKENKGEVKEYFLCVGGGGWVGVSVQRTASE